MLSMETGTPRATIWGRIGCKRLRSSSAETGSAPYGRVDSAPISIMSAPSAIIRRAAASARSGSKNWPPSENESGVILRTPMTAGSDRDKSARQPAWVAESAAAGTVVDRGAIMESLCAVHAGESRRWRHPQAGFEKGLTPDQ